MFIDIFYVPSFPPLVSLKRLTFSLNWANSGLGETNRTHSSLI